MAIKRGRARFREPTRRGGASFSGSLRPGAASTPLAVSMAKGRTVVIASATFSGRIPPERIRGMLASCSLARDHSKRSPVPPVLTRHIRIEHVEVGSIGRQAANRRRVPNPGDLDHLQPAATCGLLAVRGALFAVQLEHRQAGALRHAPRARRDAHLRRRPTISTRRLSAAPISTAAAGSHARGLSGWKIIPIAQAPCDAASSASVTFVTPQIFTFVLIPTIVDGRLGTTRDSVGGEAAAGGN